MDSSVAKALIFEDVNLPGFKDTYKQFTVSDTAKKQAIGKGIGALALGAALCWNPAGWGLLALGAAGVIGGLVANKAGSAAGSAFASDETHSVRIGDNIEEIEKTAHEIYPKLAEQLVHYAFSNSMTGAFTAMENFVMDSQEALHTFGKIIEAEVMQ